MPERLRTPVLLHLRHGHRAAQGAQRLLRRVPGPVLRYVRFAPLTHALLSSAPASAQLQLSQLQPSSSSASSQPHLLAHACAPHPTQVPAVHVHYPKVTRPAGVGALSATCGDGSSAWCELRGGRRFSFCLTVEGVGTLEIDYAPFPTSARVPPPAASDNHVGSRARKEQPG